MAIDFGKQVGPLPLGAWVVVVGGGLGIAYYSYTRSGSSDPTVVDDTSSPAGVGDGTTGGWTTTSPATGTASTSGSIAPTTNEEWAYQATQFLIGLNTPPTTAQSATSKYIAEQQLSVSEYALINLALLSIGPLPSPLANAGGITPPSTTSPTKVAPSGVKITSAGKTSLSVDWTPLSGVIGYRVFINGKQYGGAVVYSAETVRSLKANTTYKVGVCGVYPGTNGINGPVTTITAKTAK